jgi:hypothetical protein
MGNFGSKGGLHRIAPVSEDHSSEQFVLSDYFRRVTPSPGEEQPSAQEQLIREIVQASHTEDKKEERDIFTAITRKTGD